MKSFDNAIFEDNHLLIIDKPAGMLTQGANGEEGLEELLKKKHKFLRCVHRIDAPVSGIVVFAKSSKALSRLNTSMREKLWTKIYIARIEGILKGSGTLEHNLLHGDRKAIIDPTGKKSILKYQVLESGLVEIELITGRYHQIRVQFSAIGHPIVGDVKYGATQNATCGPKTIDLHHHRLTFPHPITKELVQVVSNPDNML